VGVRTAYSVPPNAMVHPTANIIFEKGGRRKRGGTAHVYSAAFSGAPKILGVHDCTFNSGTQYVIVATDDGYVYKNDTDTIATTLGTAHPYSFAFGENKLFIADGVNEPHVWSGSGNTVEVSEPAADWAASPPFQLMPHSRGASQRMAAINRTTLYLSKSYNAAGDMEKFITDAESFYMNTGDGSGLIGMAELGSEIVVFGKRKAYRLDDSDISTSNWGFSPAQWGGGAANWRLIVKIPSGDIICMVDDGDIYSVVAASEYGDYKAASLIQRNMLHDYIKEYINLAYINNFHAVYYPNLRAVVFFVTSFGKSTNDTAILYFVDRPVDEAWMVHNNLVNPSGYNAFASAAIRNNTDGSYNLYTGDYAGEIWKLDQADRNDDGLAYYGGFTAAYDVFDDPRGDKHFNNVGITVEPRGAYNLSIYSEIDGADKVYGSFTMLESGTKVLGEFLLDTDILGGERTQDAKIRIGRVGKRMQYEMFNEGADEDFFISEYITDFKPMGAKQ
jgi:hypothetical protein